MVINFVLKNIKRNENGFYWQVNLEAILKAYPGIMKAVLSELKKPIAVPSLFIAGQRSDYIPLHVHDTIKKQFSTVSINTIANAGHWVQAEQADAFFEASYQFLKEA